MKYIYLLLIVILSGCDQPKNISVKEENDMYLEIIYRIPRANFPMSISCPNAKFPVPEEKGRIYFNLRITDKALVDEFYKNYVKLQHDPQGKTSFDTKAQINFHIRNRVDTLCMNNFGQTLLNGIPQKDNRELYAVIQDTIERNYDKYWHKIPGQ